MKTMSDKRKALAIARKKLMWEFFGPQEEWRCTFQSHVGNMKMTARDFKCFGPVNGHEILKRSRGGSIIDMDNIILLCDHHNGWVEDHPYAAEKLGLSKHSWEA